MKALTIKELKEMIETIEKSYGKDALNIPVILADDEELNGVHAAYDAYLLKKSDDDFKYYKAVDWHNALGEKSLIIG